MRDNNDVCDEKREVKNSPRKKSLIYNLRKNFFTYHYYRDCISSVSNHFISNQLKRVETKVS